MSKATFDQQATEEGFIASYKGVQQKIENSHAYISNNPFDTLMLLSVKEDDKALKVSDIDSILSELSDDELYTVFSTIATSNLNNPETSSTVKANLEDKEKTFSREEMLEGIKSPLAYNDNAIPQQEMMEFILNRVNGQCIDIFGPFDTINLGTYAAEDEAKAAGTEWEQSEEYQTVYTETKAQIKSFSESVQPEMKKWTEAYIASFPEELAQEQANSVLNFIGMYSQIDRDAPLDLGDRSFKGLDLSTNDLSDFNLSGADFTNADLREVVLKNTKLTGTKFTGADMRGVDLEGVDLTGAIISAEELKWATNIDKAVGLDPKAQEEAIALHAALVDDIGSVLDRIEAMRKAQQTELEKLEKEMEDFPPPAKEALSKSIGDIAHAAKYSGTNLTEYRGDLDKDVIPAGFDTLYLAMHLNGQALEKLGTTIHDLSEGKDVGDKIYDELASQSKLSSTLRMKGGGNGYSIHALQQSDRSPLPDFSEIDFSGADFSRMPLSRVDFSGADLSEANFSGASITPEHFSHATGLDKATGIDPEVIKSLEAKQEIIFSNWEQAVWEQEWAFGKLDHNLEGNRRQAMNEALDDIDTNIKQQKELIEKLRNEAPFGDIPAQEALDMAISHNKQALKQGDAVLEEQQLEKKSIDLEHTASAAQLAEYASMDLANAREGRRDLTSTFLEEIEEIGKSKPSTVLAHNAKNSGHSEVRPDVQEIIDMRLGQAIENYRGAVSINDQETAAEPIKGYLAAGNQLPPQFALVEKSINADFSIRSKPATGEEARKEMAQYASGEVQSYSSTNANIQWLTMANKMALNNFYPSSDNGAIRENKGLNSALSTLAPENDELTRTYSEYIQETHPTLTAFITATEDNLDKLDMPAIRREGEMLLKNDPGFARRTDNIELAKEIQTSLKEAIEEGSLDQNAVKMLAEYDVKAVTALKKEVEVLPDTRVIPDAGAPGGKKETQVTIGKDGERRGETVKPLTPKEAAAQLETQIERSKAIAKEPEKQTEQVASIKADVKETMQREAEKAALEQRQEQIKEQHKGAVEKANKEWEDQKAASEKKPSRWSKFKNKFSSKKETKPEDIEISGPFNVQRTGGVDTEATAKIEAMIEEGNPQKQAELEFHQIVKKQEALHGSLSKSGLESERSADSTVIDTIAAMPYPDPKLQETAEAGKPITVADVMRQNAAQQQDKSSDKRTQEGASLRNLVDLGLVSKKQARKLHDKVVGGEHDASHSNPVSVEGESLKDKVGILANNEAKQEKGISG